MFRVSYEEVKEIEGTTFLFDNWDKAFLRRLDLIHGIALCDVQSKEEDKETSIPIPEFTKLVSRRFVQRDTRDVLDVLEVAWRNSQTTPMTVKPLPETETDKERNEILGKITLLQDTPLDAGLYKIRGKIHRLSYQENINGRFLCLFEPLKAPLIDIRGADYQSLSRQMDSLLFTQEEQCLVHVASDQYELVSVKETLRDLLPLASVTIEQEMKKEQTRMREKARRLLTKEEQSSRPSLKMPKATLSEYGRRCEKELIRRSYVYLQRAEELLAGGFLLSLAQEGSSFHGLALSSMQDQIYHPSISFDAKGKMHYACDCPYGEAHTYCKHSLMIPMTIANQAELFPLFEQRRLISYICKVYGLIDPYRYDEEDEDGYEY